MVEALGDDVGVEVAEEDAIQVLLVEQVGVELAGTAQLDVKGVEQFRFTGLGPGDRGLGDAGLGGFDLRIVTVSPAVLISGSPIASSCGSRRSCSESRISSS